MIEVKSTNYSYTLPSGDCIRAVQDITLAIPSGERVAIIGANGSGKTTLVKLISGLIIPDNGSVLIDGFSTTDRAHYSEIIKRVGLIFQNPRDQIVASVVEEDTAFGPENLCLSRPEIIERVDASLTMSGASHLKKRQTYLLSAGETQRVALAGVLALRPSCLIFDETTVRLDPYSRRELLTMMAEYHACGFTIIHVTHDLDEALAAERILVLSHGKLVMDGSPREIFEDAVSLQAYNLLIPPTVRFARDLSSVFPQISPFFTSQEKLLADLNRIPTGSRKGKNSPLPQEMNHSKEFISVEHLFHSYMMGTSLAYRALEDVTFTIDQGDCTGLIGHTGSGKSTLLQHLNGLLKPQQGRVQIGEFDLCQSSIDIKKLRQQVGLIFQNPEAQFFETYVGDEIAYAARTLGYTGKLRDLVRTAMEMVGLDFETFVDRPLSSLSGGEKRKAALASYLVVQPQVLLLDEPFAGLDPLIHQEMVALMNRLKNDGKILILSTHQMRDLLQITQQAIVMQKGKLVFKDTLSALFDSPEIQEWKLGIPLEMKIAGILRKKGWEIPAELMNWNDIFAWLNTGTGEHKNG